MIGQAASALVAAVWQGILLAAVVGLGLRLAPKTPAAVRFAIWFGVFMVVMALPVALVWPHSAGASVGGRGAWLTFDPRWSLAIAAVWVAASLVRAVTLVVAGFRVRALWKRATPVAVSQNASPWSTSSNMGHPVSLLSRRAQLCVSDEVDRPTVIGFFAPKIVIPGWLLEKLTPAELEQVVLHESGHLGRADDWMNLLQKIALMIFPLNPALAWVERRLCFERELAVDERVLRAFGEKPGAATEYAACLATVAEYRLGQRGFALALGALGRESELGRRVRRILKRGELMRPAQARLVLGGALLGLVAAAAGLEHCPELVGFAATPQTVAQADVVNVDGPLASKHALNRDSWLGGVNVPHAVLMKAAVPMANPARSAAQRPKARAEKVGEASKAEGPRATEIATSLGDGGDRVVAQPELQSARLMQQWVVVTEWQGSDGAGVSRMVMTSAAVENPQQVRAQRTRSDMEPLPSDAVPAARQDSEQVHRYAAVPVRGGWLIVQL